MPQRRMAPYAADVFSRKIVAWCPDRQDMIWIDFNPQAGREMRDPHPLAVLSPHSFNERTGIVIGLPMTTAEYNASNPFAVKADAKRGVASYILTHQPKSFDWRARRAKPHPMGRITDETFLAACDALEQIIRIGR